jgi:ribosomal-protein-alanine N-acetyltransferase
MFPERIETDRLVLERLSIDHLFELYEHKKTTAPGIEEITRYVTWSPDRSLNETREFIEQQNKQWNDGKGATYLIRLGETEDDAGSFAGIASLSVDWNRRTGTFGTWLRKEFWGRGYSGERAGALLNLAFDRLDLEVVSVGHHPDNEQSERAVQKYVETHGGRREGHLRNNIAFNDGSVHDEIRYSITQEEYQDATQ